MAAQYDQIGFLVEEHRRELLAEAALARRGIGADRLRPALAPRRLRAGAAALHYGLAVRHDRRYALGELAVTR
jgi:hypothetical protein